MPLIVPPIVAGKFQHNNTVTNRNGITVTASSTINTKGSWISLSIDPVDAPSYGMYVKVRGVSSAGAVRNYLLDIGFGDTGGGNEVVAFPNLGCGGAGTNSLFGQKEFFLPVYIPSGVALAARSQSNVSSQTAEVSIYLCQNALYPWTCGGVVDYGTDTGNSRGTSVTPGSGAFGSWTQITSGTSRNHKFFSCVTDQLGDVSIAATPVLIELGVGPDSSNVTVIYQGLYHQSTDEWITAPIPYLVYAPVSSGSAIWCRIASGETEARGVIAYGMD